MVTVWWRGDVVLTAAGRPVPAPAALVHQEYGPIVLPSGTYRVRRQRGYAPEAPLSVAG